LVQEAKSEKSDFNSEAFSQHSSVSPADKKTSIPFNYKMGLYGVNSADANAVIAMAIGGEAAAQLFEGVEKFDIRIRYPEEFRKNEADIGNLLIPTQDSTLVPLKEISDIHDFTGPCLIFRDNNQRYSALKFSIRGRDMGSTIKEAIQKTYSEIPLKKGYSMAFQGDFENKERATKRLQQMVPVSLSLILILLIALFGNIKDALLVFLNVPFAIVGGIAALLITGTNFSISAGIGFIALFGICVQDGVLLITIFKKNLETEKSLFTAIKLGVASRVRPVMMTALMAAIGLCPAAISTGIGSESSRPLARVVIGGILYAMMFSLLIFPMIFSWAYRHKLSMEK
jgi:cobalt-zinc-cadmium resistance protein CzcA